MDLIKRTEVLSAERDLKAIRKALESISDKIAPVSKETNVVVSNGLDPFFGKIYMSQEHLDAYMLDADSIKKQSVFLIEELSELQQAITKGLKHDLFLGTMGDAHDRDNFIEEVAHVLICIDGICTWLGIKPEDIQKEIYKKYPDGYSGIEKEDYYSDNAKYVSVDCSCD